MGWWCHVSSHISVNIGGGNGLSPARRWPLCLVLNVLSPLDKMAAILQIFFSDVLSWMKNVVFWLQFHWSLFLRVQLTITQHCLDNGLAPNRRQAIIWTNADSLRWRIYAALVGDELITHILGSMSMYGSISNKHPCHFYLYNILHL